MDKMIKNFDDWEIFYWVLMFSFVAMMWIIVLLAWVI